MNQGKKRLALLLICPAFTQFSDLSWKWVGAPWMAQRALSAKDGRLRDPLER